MTGIVTTGTGMIGIGTIEIVITETEEIEEMLVGDKLLHLGGQVESWSPFFT